ncbi:uncharacterized protein FIBRA_05144 [Fibroporia radiculosa]|uniref:Uncharacterized protein n=1 Tax=Fibroporia radiculosa TaxID=599839 RepID=J4HX11_9APHY|nr:uncharacterized protein FIBRA_05144 [Fibroporia radiculosa]CCM03027.1 predicted protein [Fibroporia radiculosa]
MTNILSRKPHPHQRTVLSSLSSNTPRPCSPLRQNARFTAKKASATVSLTNTHVSRVNTACILPSPSGLSEPPQQSFIPFPSPPIPCPSHREEVDELSTPRDDQQVSPMDWEANKEQLAPQTANWSSVRRRTPRTCLTAPHCHREPPAGSTQANIRRVFKGAQHRAMPAPSPDKGTVPLESTGRKLSMSCGSPYIPRKRARKAKKVTPDMQFLALVHRSIAWHARGTLGGVPDDCAAQDVLFAKRLWTNLVELGGKPVRFEDDVGPRSYFTESQERTCLEADPGPRSPTDDTRVPSAEILAMPQLVASLTLRFRDRSTSRSRSPPTADMRVQTTVPRASSPLANVLFSSSDADPSDYGL